MAALQVLAMPLGIAAVVRLALTRNASLSFVPPSVKQTTGAAPAITRTCTPPSRSITGTPAGGTSRQAGALILSFAARLTHGWKPAMRPCGHAALLRLGHLGVDDAAAGRHPLHAAGFGQADVARAVSVAHPALEHDRHRLEAAVRMAREAADAVARGVAAEGVEPRERVEAPVQRLGQHAGELDAVAVAVRSRQAALDALNLARAPHGSGGGWGGEGVHRFNAGVPAPDRRAGGRTLSSKQPNGRHMRRGANRGLMRPPHSEPLP